MHENQVPFSSPTGLENNKIIDARMPIPAMKIAACEICAQQE